MSPRNELDEDKVSEIVQKVVAALGSSANKQPINWPMVIIPSALACLLSIGASLISGNAANAARDVRIDELSRRTTLLETNTESKDDFKAFQTYLGQAIDEIKKDLTELRTQKGKA